MSVAAKILGKASFHSMNRDILGLSGVPVAAAINYPVSVRPISIRASMMLCRCSLPSSALGDEVFSVTSSTKFEFDYLGQSTKGDLNVNFDLLDSTGIDQQSTFQGPIEEVARMEAQDAEDLLRDLGIPSPSSARNSPRGIFCSRTLNLRSISAIGYDMDYTLMHYNVMAWEGRAYDYCMDNLRNMGFPVDGLSFDPDLVIRGLVIDKEKGNLVKADRFGYVKRAMHGTEMLSTQAVSEMYGRELVDLRKENRWEFLNTLFSVSEAVAYMQMVDRLDEGAIAAELGPLDYRGLYKAVGKALFRAHVEGQLKSEIMSKPEMFVEPDPELPLALLDQREAGKKLLLITNSDYHYTDKMMKHSFNRFLPNDMGWRDLFEMVIVSARKPEFFQMSHPLYEVVTGEGLMRPCFKARTGGLYSGGSAQMIENSLNIHGDEILYVGDHIYTDVSQSKVHLRWRTALICRELEEEYTALICSRGHRAVLVELINQKEVVGDLFNQLRLALQRRNKERPAQTLAATNMDDQELTDSMKKLLIVMQRLDEKIAPMLEADGELFNKRWGFLSRAGLWDKSHLMRQIEKYADIYTSRVSNFLHYTPFMYFKSQEQDMLCSFFSIVGDPSKGFFCIAQGYTTHFFCVASFLWTTTIAFTLHRTVVLHKTDVEDLEAIFHLYVWGTSLVMTVLRSIGNSHHGHLGAWCWTEIGRTRKAIQFITFYAPLWGAILYNGFTYFQVIRMLNNATRMAVGMSDRAYQFDSRPDLKALNRWGYYPLILIGSWAFGTINRIHDFIAPGHKILWLSVLDVGTAALMGLFNSIAYGLNTSVRRAIYERLDLLWPDRLRRWFPNGTRLRNQAQDGELVSLKIQDQR